MRDSTYSLTRLVLLTQAALVFLAPALACFNGSVLVPAADTGSGVWRLKVLHAAQAVVGTTRYAVLSVRSGWEGRLDYLVRHHDGLVDTQYFLRLPAAGQETYAVPGQGEAFFALPDLGPPGPLRGTVTVVDGRWKNTISFSLAIDDPPRPTLPGQYRPDSSRPVVFMLDPTVVRTDLGAVAETLHSKAAEEEPRLAPWREEVDAALQGLR